MAAAFGQRCAREIRMLTKAPPPGISAWPANDDCRDIQAVITGPEGSVYEGGVFRLSVTIPCKYPSEPPAVRFQTPIYHPNIDETGRICLDILNMPPKGSWGPAQTIRSALVSVRVLMSQPNPDDGLLADVAEEYLHRRAVFADKARSMVRRHASADGSSPPPARPPTGTAAAALDDCRSGQVGTSTACCGPARCDSKPQSHCSNDGDDSSDSADITDVDEF